MRKAVGMTAFSLDAINLGRALLEQRQSTPKYITFTI